MRLPAEWESINWTLIKVYALVKTDLKTLATTPQPLIQNQDFKELTLFDNF